MPNGHFAARRGSVGFLNGPDLIATYDGSSKIIGTTSFGNIKTKSLVTVINQHFKSSWWKVLSGC